MNAIPLPWPFPEHSGPLHAAAFQRLFDGLTARQKSTILEACNEDVYADGEIVPCTGTGSAHPEFVLRGTLRKEVTDADGASRLFGLAFAGEMLTPPGLRTAGIRRIAMGETVLLSCEPEVFAALMSEIPALRMNYLKELQRRLDETRKWQVVLGRKTAMERVAALLLSFWERQGRPAKMGLRLSRVELGQILCLTFETVSRQIKALEKAGTVALPQPSCVAVRDPQRLFIATGEAVALRRAA